VIAMHSLAAVMCFMETWNYGLWWFYWFCLSL